NQGVALEAQLTVIGHFGPGSSLAVSPDGKLIATDNSDGTTSLLHADSGKLEMTLRGQTGPVTSVALSPDGAELTVSSDKTIHVWNVHTGETRVSFQGVSFQGNEGVIAIAFTRGGEFITRSSNGMVYFLSAEDGHLLRTIKIPDKPTD